MKGVSAERAIEVPDAALHVIGLLEAAGKRAYVVGGCVRDALLGRAMNDWDITTSARPDEVKAIMAAAGIKTADTGIKYGTVTVLADGQAFETTTFRSDGAYSDGRHPDSVELLGSIEGDLARRDFTVNAMAYNPREGIVDLHGGMEDLKAGILRCVGDAHTRFAEDALRIMRGLRFSAQLGFAIEKGTAEAIHADAGLLGRVSAERIAAELSKLVCAPYMGKVLLEFSDVVSTVLPEIAPSIGFDQRNRHHCYTVWEHCVHTSEHAAPEDLTMRYAALFHDIGKPACFFMGDDGQGHFYGHRTVSSDLFARIAKRLKLPRKLADQVELLVRYHDANLPTTAKGMRHWALKFGRDTVRQIFELHRCDVSALAPDIVHEALANIDAAQAFFEDAISEVQVSSTRDLAVNGRDLLGLGLPEGPAIGKALGALLEAVVDGELENEPQALLAYASEHFAPRS